MSSPTRRVLGEEELQQALTALPRWNIQAGQLVRKWKFQSFGEAMSFVNRVAVQAEAADHHPDIDVRYNVVRLALVTHSSGGITPMDVEFALQVHQDEA